MMTLPILFRGGIDQNQQISDFPCPSERKRSVLDFIYTINTVDRQ